MLQCAAVYLRTSWLNPLSFFPPLYSSRSCRPNLDGQVRLCLTSCWLPVVKADWLLQCALKRLACRIVCPWCLRQFSRGVTLAFTMDLEYTVNTLFKVRAVTMQALLQHPFHALRPVYQRVHLD